MAYTTIDDPTAYFQTKLYTGNSSTQSITFDGNTNMQPDLVWIKSRSANEWHQVHDSVRGVAKYLFTNEANAQGERSPNDQVTSFDSNGFSLGAGANDSVNTNSGSYASWNWKKQAGVFDIQTYSGASNTRTISHNLGSVPKAMIFKRFDDGAWIVYHADAGGANKYLVLNTTAAVDTATTLFNNTVPTSSVFSVGNTNSTNGSGIDYVVYLFGNKQGVSKCGSYVGNGNADGPMIWTGFSPSFVMVHNTETASQWTIWDNKRSAFNLRDKILYANGSNAEATATTESVDFLSNGFKIRGSNSGINTSGEKYIYMSFASSPFTTSTGIATTAK